MDNKEPTKDKQLNELIKRAEASADDQKSLFEGEEERETIPAEADSETEAVKQTEESPVDQQEQAVDNNGDDSGDKNGDDDLYTPSFKPGEIINRSITEEMKTNYLDYSMSVIVARALPEVRDGLKPSQRRILVAMNDLGLSPSAHYRKSAKIAGDTSGNYHPHGEAIVYPTMVKLAQDFAMRYKLVDGQGNFGSIDGDMPAAMRYTEAKLTKITMEMLRDLDKGTVLFVPNYDYTRDEPSILPSIFPNLLCNGCDGIAVGMATKIAPHNLGEIVDALREMISLGNTWKGKAIYNELREKKEKGERIPATLNSTPHSFFENYVNNSDPKRDEKLADLEKQLQNDENEGNYTTLYPEFESDITTEDIIKFIPGPDFPTGGTIYDRKEVLNTYSTGRGRVLCRAKAAIEEGKAGRFLIIVTEIPYQVNKAHLIENMADLVKDKKIEGISDIRDESNREGMRVVITLKKDAQPKIVLNKLYKYTEMQKAFNSNMIALVDGEPQILNLKNILELFLTHRMTITIRRYEFDLAQDRFRAHILEGYLKALDAIDEVISTIRASKTQEDAKVNLIAKFDFTEAQASAILEMQLRRLAALERQKIKDEFDELENNIATYKKILSDPSEILRVIDEDLAGLKEKFPDARRTKVVAGKVDEISEEDIVQAAETFVTISHSGYIKRLAPDTYRLQRRGGKGVIGATTKEDDYIAHALMCNTHSDLMLFTNRGRAFQIKAYEIPESGRTAKGLPLVNLIQTEQGEIVTSVLSKGGKDIKSDDGEGTEQIKRDYKYLFMTTKYGTVKKTELEQFDNIRSNGLISIKLEQGDELKWVQPTTGKDDIMLVTKDGKCIRFHETDVRDTGRATMGVTGIRFKNKEDEVISMDTLYTEVIEKFGLTGEETQEVTEKDSPEKEDEGDVKDVVASNDIPRLFTLSERGFGKMTVLTEYSAQHRGGTGVFTFKVRPKTGKLVVAKVVYNLESEIIVMSTQGQVIRSELKGIRTLNRQTSGVKVMNMHENDSVAAMASR